VVQLYSCTSKSFNKSFRLDLFYFIVTIEMRRLKIDQDEYDDYYDEAYDDYYDEEDYYDADTSYSKPKPSKPKKKPSKAVQEPSVVSKEDAFQLSLKVLKVADVVGDMDKAAIKEILLKYDGNIELATNNILESMEISAMKMDVVVNKPPTFLTTGPPIRKSPAPPPGIKDFVLTENIDETYWDHLKPSINLVVVGHVDAGKSTLMGHLLYNLNYVSQKTMHKYEKESREMGKASFAYAWIMDEEEEERERGVTVDVGIKYFETEHRRICLLDAPGHRDFIPNMITGATQGDVAILVVPGNEGEFESSFQENGQTKEHAVLVRYCGIRKLVIAVNKMDSCDWSQQRFVYVKDILSSFLTQHGYVSEDLLFIPLSGMSGENLCTKSQLTDWYQGPTLVDAIDSLPPTNRPVNKPLRMVVADVYKSMVLGPITVSGKLESGYLKEKQQVLLAPLGIKCRVKGIQRHVGNEVSCVTIARAGETVDVGLTGVEDNMVNTSTIICDVKYSIPVIQHFTAEIVTLDGLQVPLLNGTKVTLHIQSVQVPATISRLLSVDDGGKTKKQPRFVRKNQTATVEVQTEFPICIEKFQDFRPLSRILLRQNGITVAAGRRI